MGILFFELPLKALDPLVEFTVEETEVRLQEVVLR